jgi:hypothetical protein
VKFFSFCLVFLVLLLVVYDAAKKPVVVVIKDIGPTTVTMWDDIVQFAVKKPGKTIQIDGKVDVRSKEFVVWNRLVEDGKLEFNEYTLGRVAIYK